MIPNYYIADKHMIYGTQQEYNVRPVKFYVTDHLRIHHIFYVCLYQYV